MTLTPSDAHRIGLEAEALGARATPGPFRGDRFDGTVKYAILAFIDPSKTEYTPAHQDETITVLEVDHKNGTSGFRTDNKDEELVIHALNNYASLGSWAARWAKVVEAAEAWLTARTALEAADRARSYRDEIEVFECAEKTLADEVRKARGM